MKQLMLMAAAVMSVEHIVEKLENSIETYKFNKSVETYQKMCFHASLLLTKDIVDSQGMEKVMKEMDQMDSMSRMMNPNNQN